MELDPEDHREDFAAAVTTDELPGAGAAAVLQLLLLEVEVDVIVLFRRRRKEEAFIGGFLLHSSSFSSS
jgi:hypothetical protein